MQADHLPIVCVSCKLPIRVEWVGGEPICEFCLEDRGAGMMSKAAEDEEQNDLGSITPRDPLNPLHYNEGAWVCVRCGIFLLPDHVSTYCSEECERADNAGIDYKEA